MEANLTLFSAFERVALVTGEKRSRDDTRSSELKVLQDTVGTEGSGGFRMNRMNEFSCECSPLCWTIRIGVKCSLYL